MDATTRAILDCLDNQGVTGTFEGIVPNDEAIRVTPGRCQVTRIPTFDELLSAARRYAAGGRGKRKRARRYEAALRRAASWANMSWAYCPCAAMAQSWARLAQRLEAARSGVHDVWAMTGGQPLVMIDE